jgi:hypothetical protein
MRNVFARGAVAGAIAGLLTSVAAYLWLEPVLSRAIALEGPSDGEGPVSRETQKLLGMPAGFLLVGLALGLLFAAVYRALPAAGTAWQRSTALAAGGFVALALIPQLRYPANPPGVGDPDTIAGRTGSYLLAVALGVAVVAGSALALRQLRATRLSPVLRHTSVAVLGVLVVGVGYALLPDSGGAVDAPAALVYDFRVRSLGLLALLYALLGVVFGAVSERVDPLRATEHPKVLA